ncbi:PAS domain-containing methyl-accepting chemotaxis protein [Paraburkholderia mimosarum]|uniref:methyl-accepting chemotaxis protein n=1 Tax=Paraburkholderia mimosarum TaxID=312026 RepID=UPI0003FED646|nr:PAS domain-containing methyl-accepting chemotaxis protein [Paraburkholderia mimosarum]
MRDNQPVTQHEYPIAGNQTLVSVTDRKGRITYCNQAFIDISGFSREELLGQPHNIVRHPDMPEEAFRDMWDTLQKGLPWSGVVKNRRKNGDHYWVRANATPMMDADRVRGYLSVRSVPSRDAITAAEGLYAVMRDEARMGRKKHLLREGKVARGHWLGRVQGAVKISTETSLVVIQFAAACATVVPAALRLPLPVTLAAASVSAAAAFILMRSRMVRPLHNLITDANQLASGDLAHPVAIGARGTVGKLQQALMQMSVNLRAVVNDVRNEANQLRIAIGEIVAANNDLSARTESQAASLEETAASMEQINGIVRHSADAASRGADLARDMSQVTVQGNDAVEAVAETMEGIAESAGHINDITQLIDGIAFQTNILALNAAVEAARAGNAGRSFAVVASEVRALAQRTSAATREIKDLLDDATQRVAQGRDRTSQARERMKEVLSAVTKVDVVLGEISVAADEQHTGVAQIGSAVTQMDTATQQNAAMVEELAVAAGSLNEQAERLTGSTQLFRLSSSEAAPGELDAVESRRKGKVMTAAA